MLQGIAIFMFVFIFLDCYTSTGRIKVLQPNRTLPLSILIIIVTISCLIFGVAISQTFLQSYKLQVSVCVMIIIYINVHLYITIWDGIV